MPYIEGIVNNQYNILTMFTVFVIKQKTWDSFFVHKTIEMSGNFPIKPSAGSGGVIHSESEHCLNGRRTPMKTSYQIYPIGFIEKSNEITEIDIFDEFTDALLGLESFSHIHVLYWFHQNDIPDKRRILRVHPRKNEQNPLTGVFATHSPIRPNLLAMSLCRILSIASNRIRIDTIDAHNGSPVIDIKCYFPPKEPLENIHLPDWV